MEIIGFSLRKTPRMSGRLVYLVSVILFLFFQAEDGIRDWSVTGVQTCALPIHPAQHGEDRQRRKDHHDVGGGQAPAPAGLVVEAGEEPAGEAGAGADGAVV